MDTAKMTSGCVLYRRDGSWIDVGPQEAIIFMDTGEFSDSPAGPWLTSKEMAAEEQKLRIERRGEGEPDPPRRGRPPKK